MKIRMQWSGSFRCWMASAYHGIWQTGATPKDAHDKAMKAGLQ